MPAVTRPLTPNELLAKVEKWVTKLTADAAKKYRFEYAELLGEVNLFLVQRAPRYDPDRSAPTTWATVVVKSAVRRQRQKRLCHRHRRRPSLSALADRGVQVLDLRSHDPADEAAAREDCRIAAVQVPAALESLPPRLRRIVEARFLAGEPLTLGQLGEEMGITRERVRQLEAKALRLMGDVIKELAA